MLHIKPLIEVPGGQDQSAGSFRLAGPGQPQHVVQHQAPILARR